MVFPTRVGVFPSARPFGQCAPGLPHASGGVSVGFTLYPFGHVSSPREWGCFYRHFHRWCRARVFPTRVGVFPSRRCWRDGRQGLPHASGGVSQSKVTSAFDYASSPREWGCFSGDVGMLAGTGVFPTRVGVFLGCIRGTALTGRLPHASGGVSSVVTGLGTMAVSSPREWGCFYPPQPLTGWHGVFPTRVGVFPPDGGPYSLPTRSSPREWGCFLHCGQHRHQLGVFPTRVGVFPTAATGWSGHPGLPHASGGVSVATPRAHG